MSFVCLKSEQKKAKVCRQRFCIKNTAKSKQFDKEKSAQENVFDPEEKKDGFVLFLFDTFEKKNSEVNIRPKGQLISKANCQAVNSSKKTNK